MNDTPSLLRRIARRTRHLFSGTAFHSSDYWLGRYAQGGNSGPGSYSHLAAFKAEVINDFVHKEEISSVIEFGCGDGNQLALASYPSYTGFDISPTAIEACTRLFATDASKRFAVLGDYRDERAELGLSLDVIFHLVEDGVFVDYMRRLFGAATRFVVIYSSDTDDNTSNHARHVRHRMFSRWVADNVPAWTLAACIPNRYAYNGDHTTTSFSNFHIYKRKTA